MKARPILFSAPMVRSLLDGRKTQTRRAIRNVDAEEHPFVGTFDERHGLPVVVFSDAPGDQVISRVEAKCPYGQPGDMLWVRESFSYGYSVNDDPERRHLAPPWYWADGNPEDGDFAKPRPSIHQPRWASRLTLELTGVRVERLQDISEADARAEGIEPLQLSLPGGSVTSAWRDYQRELIATPNPVRSYESLWETINGTGSWAANPWAWCLSFRVHHQNVDAVLAAKAAA